MDTGKKKQVCQGCSTCEIKDSCHRINGIAPTIEYFAKWGGTALFFIGSLLFATTLWAGNTPVVFSLFAVWHSLWTLSGYFMRGRSIIWLNCMYLVFDICAISIRL